MIHSDGSLADSVGGYGAIIRYSEDEALIAATGSSHHSSINVIELEGVELGMNLAEK